SGDAQGDGGIVGPEGLPLPGYVDGFGGAPESQQEPEKLSQPLIEKLLVLDLPGLARTDLALMGHALLVRFNRLGGPSQILECLAQAMPGAGAITLRADEIRVVAADLLPNRDGASVGLERLGGMSGVGHQSPQDVVTGRQGHSAGGKRGTREGKGGVIDIDRLRGEGASRTRT